MSQKPSLTSSGGAPHPSTDTGQTDMARTAATLSGMTGGFDPAGDPPWLAWMTHSPLPMAVVAQGKVYFNDAFGEIEGLDVGLSGQQLPATSPLHDWIRAPLPPEVSLAASDSSPVSYWQVQTWPVDGASSTHAICLVPQTRRVLAEQALQTSEEALSALMAQTPSLLWRCTPSGTPVWCNRKVRDMAGVGDDAVAPWHALMVAEDLDRLLENLAAHTHDRRPFAVHVPLSAKATAAHWHRLQFNPLFDTSGTVSSWAVSGVDIDFWHRGWSIGAQEDAELPSGDDLIWRMDGDGSALRPIGPGARHDWALAPDGQPTYWEEWCALVRAEDRAQAFAMPERVLAGETVRLTLQLASPATDREGVLVHAFPLGMREGGPEAIGGLFRPVARIVERRAYWVRIGEGNDDLLDYQKQTLAMDQIRLLSFNDGGTFSAVAPNLEPGALVFEAPNDPARLFDLLGGLEMVASKLPWVVIGTHNYPLEAIVRLMRMGAIDVLSATTGQRIVAESIRAAVAKTPQPEPVTPVRDEKAELRARFEGLTKRERQVLEGLLQGGTNKTIAINLKLSPRTVESHRAHLMDRVGAKSLADLLRIAAEADWRR